MSNCSKHQQILLIEDNRVKRIFPLKKTWYSLGRAAQTSIVIRDRQVSRYHATLLLKKNRDFPGYDYWIIDGDLQGNKSTNGLFIEGTYRLVHQLKNRDLIFWGERVKLRYYKFPNSRKSQLLMKNLLGEQYSLSK